jgi:CheY-like chemotaxis protein
MRHNEEDLGTLERTGARGPRTWWEEEALAQINHELRNALSSIVSALQILRHEGYSSSLAEQAGQTIERQTGQLARLADRLSEGSGVPRNRQRLAQPRPLTGIDRLAEVTPRRILIVDDNRDAADSTGTLLLLWGHQVRVAYDGLSAVALARTYLPDVCLIDLAMPGMSGYQVVRQLRNEPGLKPALLIALTGFDQQADRKQSREAGFDAYLVKPVELAALQEVLVSGTESGAAGA